MTSTQFESYNRSEVFERIMKRNDLSEEDKLNIAAKKLKEIVKK